MPKTPLLTIILPTKNRKFLIPFALASLLGQSFRDFEVIILDNDDTSATSEVFHGPLWGSLDERFRYIRTGGLWMTENFETGIKLARGKYMWLMEDKAFVVNGGLELIMKTIEKHQTQCLSFQLTNHEVSPEMQIEDVPLISINFFNQQPITEAYSISTKETMKAFLSGGFMNSLFSPRSINSVISMDVVNKICKRTGSFYKHPDPDVTAMCLTLDLIDSYHHLEYAPVSNAFGNHNIGNDKLSNGLGFRTSVAQGIRCLQAVPSETWREMERMPIGAYPLFHNMIFFDFLNVQRICCGNLVGMELTAEDYFRTILADADHLAALNNPMHMVKQRIANIRDNYPHQNIQLA